MSLRVRTFFISKGSTTGSEVSTPPPVGSIVLDSLPRLHRPPLPTYPWVDPLRLPSPRFPFDPGIVLHVVEDQGFFLDLWGGVVSVSVLVAPGTRDLLLSNHSSLGTPSFFLSLQGSEESLYEVRSLLS